MSTGEQRSIFSAKADPRDFSPSILYQRGIYPPEDFKMVKKYGLTLFTSADESLESYIQSVMKQVNGELARATQSRTDAC